MIIHTLSIHPYADGGVGEVFKSTKHFWSFGVNSVAADSNKTEDIRDLSSDVKKQQKKPITCLHTAPVVSSKWPQTPTFIFDSKQGHLHVF